MAVWPEAASTASFAPSSPREAISQSNEVNNKRQPSGAKTARPSRRPGRVFSFRPPAGAAPPGRNTRETSPAAAHKTPPPPAATARHHDAQHAPPSHRERVHGHHRPYALSRHGHFQGRQLPAAKEGH